MSTPAFQVRFVQQFTFEVDDKTLACIYNDIANVNNPEQSVNIRAYLEVPACKDCLTLVKIVPGISFGFDFPDVPDQTAFELATVRNVLNKYCVPYCETTVLFVSASSEPGQLLRIRAIFNAYCVKSIASYIDESTFSIYEVCDIQRAVQALTLTIEQQNAIIAATLCCNGVGNCHHNGCNKCENKCGNKCENKCKKHHEDSESDEKRDSESEEKPKKHKKSHKKDKKHDDSDSEEKSHKKHKSDEQSQRKHKKHH